MSLHKRIAPLIAEGLDTQTIADRMGCSLTYVRAVRWRLKNPEHERRYRADPNVRAYRQELARQYRLRQKELRT